MIYWNKKLKKVEEHINLYLRHFDSYKKTPIKKEIALKKKDFLEVLKCISASELELYQSKGVNPSYNGWEIKCNDKG